MEFIKWVLFVLAWTLIGTVAAPTASGGWQRTTPLRVAAPSLLAWQDHPWVLLPDS